MSRIKYKKLPTQKYLRACFDYDPETGILTWRKRSDVSAQVNARCVGKSAGSRVPYNLIQIKGIQYRAHRLIWGYVFGSIPKDMEIDHIDGDTQNNRLSNLRLASSGQNKHNSRKSRRGKLPKGVYVAHKTKRFAARIQVNRKRIHLGAYDTPEEAHAAFLKAAVKYHGEFARGQ